MRIGMVGLGRMGANMVRRLLKAGHELVVYDTHAEAVRPLEQAGAPGPTALKDFVARLAQPRARGLVGPAPPGDPAASRRSCNPAISATTGPASLSGSGTPSAPSTANERRRRRAMTVKPATVTSPMKSRPKTSIASTTKAGLKPELPEFQRARLTMLEPGGRVKPELVACASARDVASKRTVTWSGERTPPGTTRANSSAQFCGSRTMPVTCRRSDPLTHWSPTRT